MRKGFATYQEGENYEDVYVNTCSSIFRRFVQRSRGQYERSDQHNEKRPRQYERRDQRHEAPGFEAHS